MRTRLSDDELAVRDAFHGFFENECPSSMVRHAGEANGFDRGLWDAVAAMGAPGMALPESAGGADASLSDLAVVAEVAGAHLAPVPLIEHAVAARAIHRAGGYDDVVAELAAGSRIATLALRPPVDGIARLVPAGAVADVVVSPSGTGLSLTQTSPDGERIPNTADLPLADRDVRSASELTGDLDHQQQALNEWRAVTAVAYVGLGQRAIELGVAYAKERTQFDVLIGTFQAIQHGYADAATQLEGARLLSYRAVWAVETGQPDASRLAGMALLFASQAARFATDRSLQYHGGYGFSEEYDIQLYHRHATSWVLQLGDPSLELARLADAEFGPRQSAPQNAGMI